MRALTQGTTKSCTYNLLPECCRCGCDTYQPQATCSFQRLTKQGMRSVAVVRVSCGCGGWVALGFAWTTALPGSGNVLLHRSPHVSPGANTNPTCPFHLNVTRTFDLSVRQPSFGNQSCSLSRHRSVKAPDDQPSRRQRRCRLPAWPHQSQAGHLAFCSSLAASPCASPPRPQHWQPTLTFGASVKLEGTYQTDTHAQLYQ